MTGPFNVGELSIVKKKINLPGILQTLNHWVHPVSGRFLVYTLRFSHRHPMPACGVLFVLLVHRSECSSTPRRYLQHLSSTPVPRNIGLATAQISVAWNIKIPGYTLFGNSVLNRLTSAILPAICVSRVTLNAARSTLVKALSHYHLATPVWEGSWFRSWPARPSSASQTVFPCHLRTKRWDRLVKTSFLQPLEGAAISTYAFWNLFLIRLSTILHDGRFYGAARIERP